MPVLIANALTDINRLRDLQSPSATFPTKDEAVYTQLINSSTQFVFTHIHRTWLKYRVITNEYHDGLGAKEIAVNHYPIITLTSIYDDLYRQFGSSTQLDYAIDPYNDDVEIIEPHRQLVRNLDGTFGSGRSNVKLDYTAGYSTFVVQEGSNDQIEFVDSTSTNFTATLAEGEYNAVSLATEIQTKMDAATGTDTITCTYSTTSHRFKIASSGATFEIKWETGGVRSDGCGRLLGFDITKDGFGATTYYSTYPALGIPEDLIDAVNTLILWRYEQIRERRIGQFSMSTQSGTGMSFDYNNVPQWFLDMIAPYRVYEL